MMRAALQYGAHGWPVLPVSPGKGPRCDHGVHSATTDERQIRRWWASNPDANVAVSCRRGMFWVLDIDPRNGGDETLANWLEEHGPLPRTWTARTGGGGVHYYFAHEERFEAIPLGHLAEGIDVKGDSRHYVLVPPSRSKSGAYRWLVSPREPLASAPRWLVDLVVKLKTPPPEEPVSRVTTVAAADKVKRARKYAQHLEPAISGQGGQRALWIAACKIARGFDLDEGEAVAVLCDEWNDSCEPAWSRDDIRRTVKRALELSTMPAGKLLAAE